MREGLNTIHQTLSPETATILTQSISDASRRNHSQTTPLHVAATLLASPSNFLRQACLRAHPNSSHPLQSRALELCVSVALDRLPSNPNNNPSADPPISNGLIATLKRAQAHQRRGCPEQQPLLAVKVDLEQFVVSILDDPSVSRVMREAGFSSPAVKANIEQSLSPSLYMNPRLQNAAAGDPQRKDDEVKRIFDILLRSKKRNPILVGDSDTVVIMREVLQRIKSGDAPAPLSAALVIPLEKEFAAAKIREFGTSVDTADCSSRLIIDLGDLKWLVESPGGIASDAGKSAVVEMGRLLGLLGGGDSRVWIVGTATCATYFRCKVYHPTMENDWDLQAVSIASRSPLSNLFPRSTQAHQRRGCPEQQPLLAVKVDLEQFVVSILDDPSVSRVMREAGFSSPAVKANIEQSLSPSLYMNPRLQNAAAGDPQRKDDEVKRIFDILLRSKKRNPILVGDSDTVVIMREVLQRIKSGDAPAPLSAALVIPLEKEFAAAKIREFGTSVDTADCSSRLIIDLGDLKWLVESPGGIASDAGKSAVVEMGRLLGLLGGGDSRVWIVGTATCATYFRCKVYHPTMENDWDLQAVSIASRSPLSNLFPRRGGNNNGILSSSVESLSPMKGLPAPRRQLAENPTTAAAGNASRLPTTLCALCMQKYEHELAKLIAKEFERSSANSKPEPRPALPPWLQLAKLGNPKSTAEQLQSKEQEPNWKQSTEELLKKWRDTCSRLHPYSHPTPPALSMAGLSNPTTIPRQLLPRSVTVLPLNPSERQPITPPGSPVKIELVLGRSKTHIERLKDSTGCTQDKFSDKIADILDLDSFKKLISGLTKRVGWQREAATAVANVVMKCKSGNGKRRNSMPKVDTWLLFEGPDKVGKRRMVSALSELVFGASPTTIQFGGTTKIDDGDDGESDVRYRGRTSLDLLAEALRRNPFSVVLMEDIDQADGIIRGRIKRAMETGRLTDSNGQEVNLGSVIFVLTADWLLEDSKKSVNRSRLQLEERILESANCGWELELSVGSERSGKHQAEWQFDSGNDRPIKLRKELVSFDLNLAVGAEDDTGEGSRNSSDLTIEHEPGHSHRRLPVEHPTAVVGLDSELIRSVDERILFKPVDFGPLKTKVSESISAKFDMIMGNDMCIKVDDDALNRIVGGLWLSGGCDSNGLEEWAERVLGPRMLQLKGNLRVKGGPMIVRLSALKGGRVGRSGCGDLLPATVLLAIDGL